MKVLYEEGRMLRFEEKLRLPAKAKAASCLTFPSWSMGHLFRVLYSPFYFFRAPSTIQCPLASPAVLCIKLFSQGENPRTAGRQHLVHCGIQCCPHEVSVRNMVGSSGCVLQTAISVIPSILFIKYWFSPRLFLLYFNYNLFKNVG